MSVGGSTSTDSFGFRSSDVATLPSTACAMALRQMDIANEIVNLAFGLLVGAVAVAVALAFGLGGRDSAMRLIEQWRGNVHTK